MCRGTQKYEIVGRGVGGQRLEILIFMGVLCVGLGLRDRNLDVNIGGEVPCGDWGRVRDRYGGILGQTLAKLLL